MKSEPKVYRLIRWYTCKRHGHLPSRIQSPDSRGKVRCIRCEKPVKRNVRFIPRKVD